MYDEVVILISRVIVCHCDMCRHARTHTQFLPLNTKFAFIAKYVYCIKPWLYFDDIDSSPTVTNACFSVA